jgi:hypothetical protein
MKSIRSRKPTMKTFVSTAILLSVFWWLNLNLALAQPAPAPVLPDPNQAPPPGVLPTPSADEPTGGGGFGGGGVAGAFGSAATRSGPYYPAESKAYGYHAASVGPAVIIHFSQPDPKSQDALQEDLNVMSLLLQKKLEEAVGENSPTYRMGIPLLLRSGQRSLDSLYLDGFGVLFTVNVNFPLVAPPANTMKENEDATGSDDWNQARRELYGARGTRESANPFGSGTVPFDADQIGALKKALLEALKNSANIRNLKSEESVVVTVFGTESVAAARGAGGEVASGTGRFGGGGRPGLADTFPSESAALETYQRFVRSESPPGAGRGTVLTVRVRKSDTEAFAKGKINLEQFGQKTTINAYVGAARPGDAARNAAYQRGYNYQDYHVAPVAR